MAPFEAPNDSLSKSLEGDLDWVVMKALEIDKSQRYSSASEFEADVSRFLESEPVTGRPPNFWYHSKKFYIKHKRSVLLTILFLFITIAGAIGTTVGYVRLQAAKMTAELEKQPADMNEESRKQIEQAYEEAVFEREQAIFERRRLYEAKAVIEERNLKIEELTKMLKEQTDSGN